MKKYTCQIVIVVVELILISIFRKKFLLSRVVRSRRASSKSRQNGGAGGHHGGSLKNGNSFHSIEDCIQEDSETYPPEVADKYHIKQVKMNGPSR